MTTPLPQPGDKYIKGKAVVEILSASDKQVSYMIHSSRDVVKVPLALFEELARKTIERGAVLVPAGVSESEMSDPAFG